MHDSLVEALCDTMPQGSSSSLPAQSILMVVDGRAEDYIHAKRARVLTISTNDHMSAPRRFMVIEFLPDNDNIMYRLRRKVDE